MLRPKIWKPGKKNVTTVKSRKKNKTYWHGMQPDSSKDIEDMHDIAVLGEFGALKMY
jgi:hypothetical protein